MARGEGDRAAALRHRAQGADDAFTRDARRSHGEASGNRLVHGDNLAAMRWLRASGFEGRFRLVYLDPPYNSGRAFAEYDDRRAPDEWRRMIDARLEAIAPLVADDGAIVAQIDDTELAALTFAMDQVFGRENRVSTITVVRSAATGHKARNAGPVNVADYLLLYAKNRATFRPAPQVKVRRGYDAAYGTFVPNRDAPEEAWRFEPLAAHVVRALGYASMRAATRALGRSEVDLAIARFAMANHRHVVRFAQPRFEAVSREAQALIERSRREPDRVLVLARPGYKEMVLRGGNRVLFLSDKVRTVGGRPELVEPLTNVWDDVPFQGIAREGGVVFPRSKKPERLMARVLEMTTQAGDWVLDPFLGSGTTAAVAHKMGRAWVGIEEGPAFDSMCVPRLARVVGGADPSGVSRAYGHRGGGGFDVYA